MEISVLVPVYNEADNVEPLVEEIINVMMNFEKQFEIVIVNDGSNDETGTILNKLSVKYQELNVIHLARNFGQTAALSAAIDNSHGEILISMDGDRQNDPGDIPLMLNKLYEGFDVVSGWRRDRKDKAISRRLPSKLANRLISWVSGVHLNDYGCSLKAYRRQVIEGVKLYGEMHRFIPIYTSWYGGKIIEIEVNHRPRVAGKSKYGLKRVWKVLLDLLVVRFFDQFLSKPIHFFGGIGVILILFGFVFSIAAIILKLVWAVPFVNTPLPLLIVFLFLVGTLLILQGLMAEIIIRAYFESQNKPAYLIKKNKV
jgi:glycosyltransferase involved in cell wall biosynthesis